MTKNERVTLQRINISLQQRGQVFLSAEERERVLLLMQQGIWVPSEAHPLRDCSEMAQAITAERGA